MLQITLSIFQLVMTAENGHQMLCLVLSWYAMLPLYRNNNGDNENNLAKGKITKCHAIHWIQTFSLLIYYFFSLKKDMVKFMLPV